ncbi:XrtA system polysaccharide deacetylase [Candidatus Zixiibacteriota bacterium]
MINILSVDVEDWFQAEAQTGAVKFADWENIELRVWPNVMTLLAIFERFGVHATFFMLGWIVEKLPGIVESIAAGGHEIGSHGYTHRLAFNQDRSEFTKDIEQSVALIRKAADVEIKGYRAPSFSIGERTPWAWKVLADAGLAYDSSIFPVHHDTYGSPDLPRYPFRFELEDGRVVDEIPLTTVRFMGHNLPAAGGGYLRLFPYWYTRRAIRAANRIGQPAVVYLHPWEIDPHQPRNKLSLLSRFRHYTNLDTTIYKLERLLSDFRFGSISEYLSESDPASRPRMSIRELASRRPLPPSQQVRAPDVD